MPADVLASIAENCVFKKLCTTKPKNPF